MASKSAAAKNQPHLLTEKELLAMPESDYMNTEQLAFFRNRLKELEQEILNNADATTENLRETQFVPDPADRATLEEEPLGRASCRASGDQYVQISEVVRS